MNTSKTTEFKKYPIMRNFDQSSSLGFVLLKDTVDITLDEVLSFEFAKQEDGRFIVVGVGLVDGADYCKFLKKRHLIYGMPKSKIVEEEPAQEQSSITQSSQESTRERLTISKLKKMFKDSLTKVSKSDNV